MICRALVLLFLLLTGIDAHAHKPSDSYLSITIQDGRIQGRWDIALRDLDYAIGLDDNEDNKITWGELRARHAAIAAYALPRLNIKADGTDCGSDAQQQWVDEHTDGAYTVLYFNVQCPAPIKVLTLAYGLFAEFDPQHRGLVNLTYNGQTRTLVLGPQHAVFHAELGAASRVAQFVSFWREGVWHIWQGYDHILFLLALLLPATLVYREHRWQAVAAFRPAFWNVVKIVTAFTLAHSLTLSFAALNIVNLPSRLVESAIAASIIAAALNNIYPLVRRRLWMLAFAFGLVHGFGFANVLRDLGLPQEALLLALVGFNLGVESGQLVIVGVILPLIFIWRRSDLYSRLTVQAGSAMIALVACVWMLERILNFKWMPF